MNSILDSPYLRNIGNGSRKQHLYGCGPTSQASQPHAAMENITYLDPVRQDLHIVKCVVVGDSGVGKTRLICSRACGTEYTLEQLTQTHVPTVWAIDHYRKDRQVLLQSWTTIDNVPSVSLRLWDTFGYHDKDRRFAYGRADVILACFSVVRPRTLQNIVNHWWPEIQRSCPGVPVILCGCQADLRYMYMDDDFIKIDKGPFFREIRECDIVTPEMGRMVANEIDAAYYETSVLEQYGIEDLFTNVIRSSLINKREKHFWNILGNLKRISRPLCQEPLLPPRPKAPTFREPQSDQQHDLDSLLQNQAFCDVIFVARGVCIQAHKICLLAASSIFEELFLSDLSSPPTELPKSTSASRLQRANSVNGNPNGVPNKVDNAHVLEDSVKQSDTTKLLDFEEVETSSGDVDEIQLDPGCFPQMTLNHPAFRTLQLQYCEDVFTPGSKILQTVVTLNEEISPTAFEYILTFLYTGRAPQANDLLQDIRRAAFLFGLQDLVVMITNIINVEGYLNKSIQERFLEQRLERLRDFTIKRSVLADVNFQVEDGVVPAHKALLTARCDVMLGMFSYNFRESSAKTIHFPGVTLDTFVALKEYLYTGLCPDLMDVDCIELIELANRLCLPRLLALTEQYVIRELSEGEGEPTPDMIEDVLVLLEPSQLHNASQLADWCLWYLSTNYGNLYKRSNKLLQTLKPDNQIYLAKRRWPPVWYLKELDYYEKCLVDLQRERSTRAHMRRGSDDTDRGCLGFCGRTRRKFMRCETSPSSNIKT